MGPMRELGAALAMTDDEARAVLERACARHPLRCPRCGDRRPYALRNERLRCRKCKLNFGPLTGRWLARCRIPARSWVVLLRCFVRLPNSRDLATLSGLAHLTAFRAVTIIRLSLMAADEGWRRLLPPSSGGGPSREHAFGVNRSGSSVRVTPIPIETVPLRQEDVVHRDGILYLDGGPDYHAVLLNGRQGGDSLRNPSPERTRAADPFLAFLLNRSALHRGRRADTFPLYVREWECRFNLTDEGFFDLLLDCLAAYVPRGGS